MAGRARSAFSARVRARPLVAGLCLVGLTACQVRVGVRVDADGDGSGRVQATVTLDRDATAQFPDLAGQLRAGDLAAAGWTVVGPTTSADGTTVVRATKRFRSTAELGPIGEELGGPGGPVRDLRLTRSHGLITTRTRFDGTVDLSSGIEAFGDARLRQRLGGSSLGVDSAELERQLGVAIDRMVGVDVAVHLPGAMRSNSPHQSGGTARWRLRLGERATLHASGRRQAPVGIVVVGLAVLVVVALTVVLLRRGGPRAVRYRRRSWARGRRPTFGPAAWRSRRDSWSRR